MQRRGTNTSRRNCCDTVLPSPFLAARVPRGSCGTQQAKNICRVFCSLIFSSSTQIVGSHATNRRVVEYSKRRSHGLEQCHPSWRRGLAHRVTMTSRSGLGRGREVRGAGYARLGSEESGMVTCVCSDLTIVNLSHVT